ncbi:RIKEN cDNA 2810021J22, isoform CRA_c, partial [Mus musculus]
ILLPVSEGVGLWPQSCASLSGRLCAVRHLPSDLPWWRSPVRHRSGFLTQQLCRDIGIHKRGVARTSLLTSVAQLLQLQLLGTPCALASEENEQYCGKWCRP